MDIRDAAQRLEAVIDANPETPVLLMDGESLIAIAVSLEYADNKDNKIDQLEKDVAYWKSVADIRLDTYEICQARLTEAKEEIAKLTSGSAPAAVDEATGFGEVLPLNAFNLATSDGRFAFLSSLYHDHQEQGLMMAVSHVWSSLGSPKSARCNKMAATLGLPGTGKIALKNVIQAFLQESLHKFDFPDLPERSDFGSSDEWSAACIQHFESIEESFEKILAKYEAVLDGREPEPDPASARILKGPWARKPFRRGKI